MDNLRWCGHPWLFRLDLSGEKLYDRPDQADSPLLPAHPPATIQSRKWPFVDKSSRTLHPWEAGASPNDPNEGAWQPLWRQWYLHQYEAASYDPGADSERTPRQDHHCDEGTAIENIQNRFQRGGQEVIADWLTTACKCSWWWNGII